MYIDALSRSKGTSEDDNNDFKIFINDYEVTDFSLFVEQLLTSNDVNFPVIMEFLKINKIAPELKDIYNNIGFGIVTQLNDEYAVWKLVRNLNYLKQNDCDLNLELLNFLRSLTFGGNLIKHGDLFSNIRVMKTILPFCTDFFSNEKYWSKIRYFCLDTQEVIEALDYLIRNYGCEKNCKYLQRPQKNPFSLKHLARNKIRITIYSKICYKSINYNVAYFSSCKANLPKILFEYVNFKN